MWRIKIKCQIANQSGYGWHYDWKDVRPTGGAPYEYATKQAAQDIINICYPLQTENEVKAEQVSQNICS